MSPQPWFWWLVLVALLYLALHAFVGWLRGFRWCKTCKLFRKHRIDKNLMEYEPGDEGGYYTYLETEFCPHCQSVRKETPITIPGLNSQEVRDSHRLWH